MSTKGELRRKYRDLSEATKPEASLHLNQKLLACLEMLERSSTKTSTQPIWAGFQPITGEPDLNPTYRDLANKGWSFAFPTVSGENLRFFKPAQKTDVCDESTGWLSGPWDLREPDPTRCEEVAIDHLTGVLVPGLAFDERGVRLGRGKGFYDRALQKYKGIKIGVVFSGHIARELPCDSHDIRVDYIVTENGVLDPKGNAND